MRRRAILSVRANPMCANEAAAERAVNEVWESCFNDTRPFDEVSSVFCLFHPPSEEKGEVARTRPLNVDTFHTQIY